MKTSTTETKATVSLDSIIPDDAFQPRMGIDQDHVDGMVEAIVKDPAEFDDKLIEIWVIGGKQYIVDGHHRYNAFKQSGRFKQIQVNLHETHRESGIGDDEYLQQCQTDALKFSITANANLGSPLKRSQEDNRRAIQLLLQNKLTRILADRKIAELVGVTSPTVKKVRDSNPEYQADQRVTSDGKQIAARKPSRKPRNEETASKLASVGSDDKAPSIMQEEPVLHTEMQEEPVLHTESNVEQESNVPSDNSFAEAASTLNASRSEDADTCSTDSPEEPEQMSDEVEPFVRIEISPDASPEAIYESLFQAIGYVQLLKVFRIFQPKHRTMSQAAESQNSEAESEPVEPKRKPNRGSRKSMASA